MNPSKLKSFLILFFLLRQLSSFGQGGGIDPAFNATDDGTFGNGLGFTHNVYSIKVQQDGRIVVGGGFVRYNGAILTNIARLNSNGTLDTSFYTGDGFDLPVNSILIQTDGKIIVGGNFTTYNNIPVNRLVRLNTDGSLDLTFNIGTGCNGQVFSMLLQPDGKIVVGGEFTQYNGSPQNRLLRLNVDGSIDAGFNIGTGFNNSVNTISYQNDGKLIVGGQFTSFNGSAKNRIVRLNNDGSTDNGFTIGTGANNVVYGTVIQPDGKIVVGGNFTSFNGVSFNRMIRLNPNGSVDNGFSIGSGFNDFVSTIEIQADGKIVVGGNFSQFNNSVQKAITRLNDNGSLDVSFDSGNGITGGSVSCIQSKPDGRILVGGNFQFYKNVGRNRIICLNNSGELDYTFSPGTGFNYDVLAIATQPDGKLLTGGKFTTYFGKIAQHLIRLNPDGSRDSSFSVNFSNEVGYNNFINTICLQPDGKILIGGGFSLVNGIVQNNIARLNSDGTLDYSFNSGTGFNGSINSISLQADGKILVGGEFSSFNGSSFNRVVRLNADGTIDLSFNVGTGFNSSVYCTYVQPDGKILVGGQFNSFNGTSKNNIVRLNSNGTIDPMFATGSGFNGFVLTIARQLDGKILIGGLYSQYNGVNRNRLVRLYDDGTLDGTFNIGTGFNANVYTISLQTDEKIIIGGRFTMFNGLTKKGILRLNTDGSLDTSFNSGIGFDISESVQGVYATSIQTDGNIVVGGNFSQYNGVTRNRIASIFGCSSSYTQFASACDSFNLNGITYTASGIYTQNLINSSGCDSLLVLNLSINNSDSLMNVSVCEAFTLNSQTYTSSGTYTQTFTNSAGCDSLLIINLTINNASSDTITIAACDSLTLNSQTYFTSGTYAQNLTNAAGCDSLLTLNLTINHSTTDTITVATCDFYTLNGQTYTASGIYSQTLTNTVGCDSLLTLILTINNTTESINIIACDTYTLNGQTYTSSGSYTQTFTNAAGCDSLLTLNLTINSPSSESVSATACDSLTLNGLTYSSSGTYTQTLTNAAGCDSLLTLNLTINHSSSESVSATACDSMTLNGQTYTSSGTYTQTLTNAAGCDSLLTLNLTINNSSSESVSATACDSMTLNGQTYTSSGTYTQTLTNAVGCDSLLTLNLTINNSSSETVSITACDSLTLNGQTFTSSGTYSQTLTNVAGCDSLLTLNLIINSANAEIVSVTACDSYTLNGQNYTSGGTYTQTLTNAAGCDSLLTLNLTINNSSSETVSATACDSLTLNGQTYTSSGTYTQTLTNLAGCDSILILNLTINNSNSETITSTACDTYTLNGQTYTTSGIYTQTLTNAAGCDSILTLNLTIIPSIPQQTNTFSQPSDPNNCLGQLAIQTTGNSDFTADIDGNTPFTYSGYHLESNLCPGVHTLTVTDDCGNTVPTTFVIPVDTNYVFNNPFIDSIAVDSLGQTIENCDIYYNSIDTAFIDSLWANGNTVNVIWNIVDSNGSNLDTNTYELNNGNGAYWLQLSVFCPTRAIGDYFTVTEAIYFEDGSVTMAGLDDPELFAVNIYPNPSNGIATVVADVPGVELTVFDTQGKVIRSKTPVNGQTTVDLTQVETGVYFFKLETEQGSIVKRVVKR